jgi:serine protease
MKIVSRIGSAGLLALVTLAAILSMPAQGAERGPLRKALSATAAVETEARVIVKFRADSALMRALSARSAVAGTTTAAADGPQHAQALSTRLGLALVDGRVLGARSQLVLAKGLSSKDLAARLGAQTDVEYAVVDGRMRVLAAPNDPLYGGGQSGTPAAGQWYLRAPTSSSIVDATSIVSAINAEAAWAITTGKRSVVVAVLDTGVRPEHPDLVGKLLPGYDFITNPGNANDGDGRDADPTDPGDGVTQADVGTVNGCVASDIGKSSWHGTQTAGLIGAATNNGEGMASVGRDVMLLPVRVLGKCGGYDSDIQAAILWAANIPVPGAPANPNPAKVINMSLGAVGSCSAAYADVLRQVADKGVVVVVAAGNDGLAVGTPANCPGVIAVGGVRHAGSKVGYSDLGPEVAISAPAGNCVNTTGTCLYPLLTTSNNGTQAPGTSIYTDGDNAISIGTSFSAPLVAGTAALMFSANATLTPAQVLTALKATARAFPVTGSDAKVRACTAPTSVAQDSECYCTTSTCGAGLLDTGAAVARVANLTSNIVVSSTSVKVGASVALGGSSYAPPGSTIQKYQWAITDGAALASYSSATNAATATLATTAAGSVTVSLTVTDQAGQSDTTTTTLTIGPLPVVTPPVVTPPSSSSGGGAMELGWLLGWLASVIGVWVVTPRPRRKAA